MQTIMLKPESTLFFRDGNIFDKEQTNWLSSKKMPYPSTFYGAVSSALLRQGKLKSVQEAIENNKKSSEINKELESQLKIKGIYIYDNGDCWLPAPRDLFQHEYGHWCIGNYRNELLYIPEYCNVNAEHFYISMNDYINKYATGRYDRIKLRSENEIWRTSNKVGIEIDTKKRLVKESHLYILDMIEFAQEDSAYLLKFESDEELDKDIVLLGGEKRTAAAHKFTNKYIESQFKQYENEFCNGDKIKLLLTSPLLFSCKPSELSKKLFNGKITVDTIVAGKTEKIGGFDIVDAKQKQMLTGISEGSVLRLHSEDFKEKTYKDVGLFIEKCMTEIVENRTRGFGRFILTEYREGKNE